MSVVAVAKKDYRDGLRSKLLWALSALFLLSIGGFSYLVSDPTIDQGGEVAVIGLLGASLVVVVFLVPLTGLVVSIKSIVRERELGSIKILLSLPHTRLEVIAGKFIGRVGLLTTAILAGFVPAGFIFVLRLEDLPLGDFTFLYGAFVFMTIMFGVVFVAVGLGISALVSTETRATIAGVGAFFLLYFWQGIFTWLNNELELFSGDAELFVRRFELFTVMSDAMFAMVLFWYGDHEVVQEMLEASNVGDQPFYLEPWFAFVILGIWIAVPLAIGYFRFQSRDL